MISRTCAAGRLPVTSDVVPDAISAMTRYLTASLLFLVACGSVVRPVPGDEPPPGDDDELPPDDDEPPPAGRCNPTGAFQAPTGRDFATVSTGGATGTFSLTTNELLAVVTGGNGLLTARRDSLAEDFDAVDDSLFAEQNNGNFNEGPSLTGDGLHVYYLSEGFVFHATRVDNDSPFTNTAQVFVDGVSLLPAGFQVAADGGTLYWVDPQDAMLRSAFFVDDVTFESTTVASTSTIARPVIDATELVLYHAAGGEILVSTRATADEPFGDGVPLTDLNSDAFEAPLAISSDNCVLYFQSDRPGHDGLGDVWKSTRSQ